MLDKRIVSLVLVAAAVVISFVLGFFLGGLHADPGQPIQIVMKATGESVSQSIGSELPFLPAEAEPSAPAPTSAATTAVPAPSAAPSEPSQPSAEAETSALVNLNTAGLEELMTLPGIGKTRAQSILTYREQHGPFLSLEQVKEISGIGDGILNKIRDYVTLE